MFGFLSLSCVQLRDHGFVLVKGTPQSEEGTELLCKCVAGASATLSVPLVQLILRFVYVAGLDVTLWYFILAVFS
jgi:hypothetical protein